MTGYSMGGFINAVVRRSNRTLLVEGATDHIVISRFKSEKEHLVKKNLPGVVDAAGILQEPLLKGMGNKERILAVLQHVNAMPKKDLIFKKLGVLVDREWDGLQVNMQLESDWEEPVQNAPHFVTKGHSVENYFFSSFVVERYLRCFYSDKFDQNFFNELNSRFSKIIALAFVFSLGMRQAGAIGKADRLIGRNSVIWSNDKYLLKPDLCVGLKGRSVELPKNFDELLNANIDQYLKAHFDEEPGKWVCHGHLGEQAIWACVANLALAFGANENIAEAIERGERQDKTKHSVDTICRTQIVCDPLHAAVDWLTE
jgi:hypothetical protein